MPSRQKRAVAVVAGLVGWFLVDVETTLYGRQYGGQEANPIARVVVARWGRPGLYGLKLVTAAWTYRYGGARALLGLGVWGFFAGLNNVAQVKLGEWYSRRGD